MKVDMVSAKTYNLSQKPVVLEVKRLRKSFDGSEVLKDVNVTLRRGEVVLLRGPNGAGKTTLINILTGHLEAEFGELFIRTNGTEERFHFPFGLLKHLNPFQHFLPEKVAREGVMRTWQDSRLFPSLRLAENIAVAAPNHPGENPLKLFFNPAKTGEFEKNSQKAATDQLKSLQLDGRDGSSGDKISLGQVKRVSIARAVNAQARILFFDEPLAGLDAQGIKTVVEMLSELAREHSISIVVVEHHTNAPHILKIADTVWTLKDGIIESCSVEQLAKSAVEEKDAFGEILKENGWRIDREESLPRGALLQIYRQQDGAREDNPVLEIRDMGVRRGKRWVIGKKDEKGKIIDTLNIKLFKGDLALLMAPNGWGKTTALDAICGIIPVSSGSIHLQDNLINNLESWERTRLGIRYLRAQDNIFPNLSVMEQNRVAESGMNGFSCELQNRRMGSLSGGEKQIAHVKRFIDIKKDNLVIMDEPFSGMDRNIAQILIKKLTGSMKDITVIIALPNK